MELKNKLLVLAAAATVFLSCSKEQVMDDITVPSGHGLSFVLSGSGYEGAGDNGRETIRFDRVEFMVADTDGQRVHDMKGYYDAATSSIRIERLGEGEYTLLALGIAGDSRDDGVTVHEVGNISDIWLSVDENLDRPLAAEYFHTALPFRVSVRNGPGGDELFTDVKGPVMMRRIVGRVDFNVDFSNEYIENAVISMQAVLDGPVLYSSISAGGQFAVARSTGPGETPSSGMPDGRDVKVRYRIPLDRSRSHYLMPSANGGPVHGSVEIQTRDYRGNTVRRLYSFELPAVGPNRISEINVDAVHPEDGCGTMFMTRSLYESGGHGRILQDDEPHGIYTDMTLRNFNTARPLQVSVTGEGHLSARFYSPRDLTDVLVRARIPGSGESFVDLAYFDVIPAFADFSYMLPVCAQSGWYRTDTGRIVDIPRLSPQELSSAEFEIVSSDPYWARLQKIRHGWNIRFDLYGGDPTLPDGGPQGNWMGIRPVHCREAVAFFLNFTYMIDMPEHEAILRENTDRLYGNGGVDDKVSVETILGQMRQTRTVNVGLVYPGNGVVGLGGGSTFGAYQGGWFSHYTSLYACEVMFHELGHVMGYNHSSSFTYGPWAQELMNNFYVSHLAEMPVDSPDYLDSASNPNQYI